MNHMTGLRLWLCWWVWSIASNSRSKIISEKSVTNARATVSTEISQPINVDLCSIFPTWILNVQGELDMSTLIGKQDRLAFLVKPKKVRCNKNRWRQGSYSKQHSMADQYPIQRGRFIILRWLYHCTKPYSDSCSLCYGRGQFSF